MVGTKVSLFMLMHASHADFDVNPVIPVTSQRLHYFRRKPLFIILRAIFGITFVFSLLFFSFSSFSSSPLFRLVSPNMMLSRKKKCQVPSLLFSSLLFSSLLFSSLLFSSLL